MKNNKRKGPGPRNNRKNEAKELWKTNNLEIITAALVMSGKLKVNSIQLTRSGALTVTLYGELLKDISSLINMNQEEIESLFPYIYNNYLGG